MVPAKPGAQVPLWYQYYLQLNAAARARANRRGIAKIYGRMGAELAFEDGHVRADGGRPR